MSAVSYAMSSPRFVCIFRNGNIHALHVYSDMTWSVSHGSKSAVLCGVPEVPGEFRSSLMKIAKAARISAEHTHEGGRTVIHYVGIVGTSDYAHLIGLL